MHQNPALAGIKRHARTHGSDVFPVLGAHISGAEFQYPDLSWKEPTGMMANLVGDSGCNKGQLAPDREGKLIGVDSSLHPTLGEKKYRNRTTSPAIVRTLAANVVPL